MPNRLIRRMRVFMRQRFGVVPLRQSLPDVEAWLETPLGQALLEQERMLLEPELQDLFGYHLLQMSVDPALDLTRGSRITHRFTLAPTTATQGALSPLVAEFHSLPLSAESLDLVLLHHLQDYSQTPHQLLREVARVLIPRGHLVIVGFNPWSLLGIGRWVARCFSDSPRWRHQSLRLGRVLDWLQLLDLELVKVNHGFYRPPIQRPGALRHLHWLERWGKKLPMFPGGVYIIVARKDLGAPIPLKPSWESVKTAPGLEGVKSIRKEQKACKSSQ
ncbi:class I SAM-dependent methyltransferase [Marinimicrobium sp. ABcell2]|uniref:class I SAM-dependent methyltransferase n=1 Tax=Marinimicrobium sp. ABcell2 TaxID=3069751 RepID=UPI0027B77DD1|nr:methyltransferase domain-containing protein [Marinimicrobium sp. ABcell2]MDQ2075705.1 methyltransferase domain-containing protein [Marinimicrobium sp. ABcell2]